MAFQTQIVNQYKDIFSYDKMCQTMSVKIQRSNYKF